MLWKGKVRSITATKPPIWANHAILLSSPTMRLNTCMSIQIIIRIIVGMRIIVIRSSRQTNVFTRVKGNRIRYPPSITEIDPLAPTIGI